MRIIQIVADGSPGGGTTVVVDLLTYLSKRKDVELTFITEKNSYAYKLAKACGIDTRGVHFFRSRLDMNLNRELSSMIGAARPDIVHVHGARAAFPLCFANAKLRRSFRFIYTVHGYHFSRKDLVRRLLGALAEKFIHKTANVSVFVCDADRRDAIRWRLITPDTPHILIYNGISAGDLPLPTARPPKHLAFVGRLCAQKNPELMVRIVERLKDRGFTATLIGGGDSEAQVRTLVDQLELSSIIRITGRLSRHDALAEFDKCGMLVLPSKWEGLPLVCQEALLMGIPTVAAAVNGVPEVIQEGRTGRLITSESPSVWSEAILQLAENADMREKFIRDGRQFALERFPLENMLQKYLAIYTKYS
jgi:glycosyltransferase involved in cell wall biosynthesis